MTGSVSSPKLTVVSIDGVPHGLLERLMAEGVMPSMARLCEECGRPRMMRSVLPTVSCVAWATYATGRNPGKHGIFGFVDRKRGSYEVTFPNASALRGANIWELLSGRGKKVFGMNVPSTYPSRPVNGILIGGFLAPSLEKVAYPPQQAEYLRSIDYRIDSDAQLARQSKEKMLADLEVTLSRRAEAVRHYLQLESWDFFHAHIMGTDRINHFLFRCFEEEEPKFASAFREYYRKVDEVIGEVLSKLDPDAPFMVLSDHGFCSIKYEVQLSRYLVEKGWTVPADRPTGPLSIDPARSKVFCLIPGRIYVNVAGREGGGCVAREDYAEVREELTKDLLELRDPENQPVIRTVLKREEVYWPKGKRRPDPSDGSPIAPPPYLMAPDLIAVPYDGYDLKMGLVATEVFARTQLEGMHTYPDALVVGRGVSLPEDDLEIRRLAGFALKALGVQVDEEIDTEYTPAPQGVM